MRNKKILERIQDLHELETHWLHRLNVTQHNARTMREAIEAENRLREIKSEKTILMKNCLTR